MNKKTSQKFIIIS